MPVVPPPGATTQQGVGPNSFPVPPQTFTPYGAGINSAIPGAAGSGNLLQGFEGLITNLETQQRETETVTREVVASSERTARLLGSVLDRAGMMMGFDDTGAHAGLPNWAAWSQAGGVGLLSPSSMVPEAPTSAPTAAQATSKAPDTPERPAAAQASSEAPTGGKEAPTGREKAMMAERDEAKTGRGTKEGRSPNSKVKEPEEKPPPWFTSFEAGKRTTMGDVRQNTGRSVARRMSEWMTAEEQTLVDAQGAPIVIDGKTQTRAVPKGSSSTAEAAIKIGENGEVVPEVVGNGGVPARARLAGIAKQAGTSLAEGESLSTSLTSAIPGIAKAAGVAGLTYMAVNKGLDFAEEQRAKNAEYQSVLGGSNSEGFNERVRSKVFGFSQRGIMSGGEAEKIYKGAMERYAGDRDMRDTYQGAAVDLYRSQGISADESTRLLNMAAEQGNTSLSALADSIKNVGKAAREAGISAEESRKNFEAAFKSTGTYTGGTTQIRSAEATANIQSQLGDSYGNVGFEGMDSELNQRRAAHNLGMTLGEYYAATSGSDPNGSTVVAQGKQSLLRQAIVGFDPNGKLEQTRKEVFDEMGIKDGQSADPGQVERASAEFLKRSGVDPVALAAGLGTSGLEITPEDAAKTYIQVESGALNYEKENEKQNAFKDQIVTENSTAIGIRGDTYKLGPRGIKGEGTAFNDALPGEKAYKQGVAYNKTATEFLKDMWGDGFGSKAEFEAGSLNEGKRRGLTGKRSEEDRMRNSISNDLLRTDKGFNMASYQLTKEMDQFKDSRFVVNTKDKEGNTSQRAVSAYDLVDKFGDQLAADPASIKILGGTHTNETVGDVLQLNKNPNQKVTSNKDPGFAKAGKDLKDAEKDAEDEKGKSGDGRIVIEADPTLLKLFKIRGAGSVESNPFPAGVPGPSNADLTPPQRGSRGS